jgi:hypothetical protein
LLALLRANDGPASKIAITAMTCYYFANGLVWGADAPSERRRSQQRGAADAADASHPDLRRLIGGARPRRK